MSAATRKKSSYPGQRLTDGVEAGLRQLATDCLRVFRYFFVAFNLAESVIVYYILDDFPDVLLYNQLYMVELS